MKKEKLDFNTEVDNKGMVLTGFTPLNNLARPNLVYDCGFAGCVLYEYLLSHRNSKTGECFPATDVLCREMDLNRQNLTKHLNELEAYGYIIIDSGHKGHSSRYYFPAIPKKGIQQFLPDDSKLSKEENDKLQRDYIVKMNRAKRK